MKKIILNEMYEIGGGIGAWAISQERGIKLGDCRVIGEILMHASTIYKRGFFKTEIWWTPVDRALCHDYDKLREWRCRT